MGEIDVFFMDESGFRADSCVPDAWQRQGETQALPANVAGRVNVIGLLNRQGRGYFRPVANTVTSGGVAEAMEDFIQSRPADKLTAVAMENASLHRKRYGKGNGIGCWDGSGCGFCRCMHRN